jgi:hypothetical protein
MDLLDLQRAVSAPHRWENVVRKNSVLASNFDVNITKDMKEGLQLRELKGLYEVVLIPGGRYVLATGFRSTELHSPVSVMLLDLGLPGGPLLPDPPVVSGCQIKFPVGYTRRSHKVTAAAYFTGNSALEVVVLVKRRRNTTHYDEPQLDCA